MAINYTQEYVETCEKPFVIDRDEVRQSFSNPDAEQKLIAQGLEIRMYKKKFENYYLLIQAHVQPGNFFIDSAIKLPLDFATDVDNMEPLDVLRAVVSKYGLLVQIGNQQSKFIYNEIIPIDNLSPNQLVRISNPNKHKTATSLWFKILNQGGQNYVQCALVYCLDTDEYLKSVK